MIINKRTVKKTIKISLYVLVITLFIGSIRVLLLGPVGNKTPGSAPPRFHIATWQEFHDELYYILACAVGAVIITIPIILAGESDKERHRIELEQKEKEVGNEERGEEYTSNHQKH